MPTVPLGSEVVLMLNGTAALTSGAFSLSTLNGSWAYGWTGIDNDGEREVNVGQFTLAAGNMTNGTCDGNGGGTFYTCTFTGTVSPVNSQTGRTTVAIQSNNGPNSVVTYVVSANETVMEGIASVSQTGNGLFAGSMLRQSGTFNKSSLNGLSVLYYQDIHSGDGLDQSGAGVLSFDGNGNDSVLAMDEDKAGTIQQDQPSQGTYSVGVNGAVTFTCEGGGCPAGFLVSQNKAMFVGTGSNSIFGMMEPQTGGPFSNASMAGTYAGGTLAPLDYVNAHNEADAGSADGLGTLTVGGDSSGSDGLDQSFGQIVNYSIAANGRGTAEDQGDQTPNIVYMISPTKWVVMLPKTDARMLVFQH